MTAFQTVRVFIFQLDPHEVAFGVILLIIMILWSCSIMDAKRIQDLSCEIRHLKGRVKTLERLDNETGRSGDQG